MKDDKVPGGMIQQRLREGFRSKVHFELGQTSLSSCYTQLPGV